MGEQNNVNQFIIFFVVICLSGKKPSCACDPEVKTLKNVRKPYYSYEAATNALVDD
jgi:hypothetical protein